MRKPEWVLDILEALQDSEVAIVKAREALETNLALTAAAPELLSVAKALVDEYKKAPITPSCLILKTMDALQDAINKAEGREE